MMAGFRHQGTKAQSHKVFVSWCLGALVLSIFIVHVSNAQEWLIGEAEVVISNITPEEARKRAFDAARVDALSKAGIEVTGVTGRHIEEGMDSHLRGNGSGEGYYDNFIKFTSTRTKGLIVEEETLEEGIKVLEVVNDRARPVYSVKIKAKVVNQTGEPDPGFKAQLGPDHQTYRNGESISVTFQATKECYVTMFSLFGNDSLAILIPSDNFLDNRFPANRLIHFPSPGRGYEMVVSLPASGVETFEGLFAVATKDNIPFIPGKSIERESLMAQGEALISINKWLAEIPRNQRTEAWVFYRIIDRE